MQCNSPPTTGSRSRGAQAREAEAPPATAAALHCVVITSITGRHRITSIFSNISSITSSSCSWCWCCSTATSSRLNSSCCRTNGAVRGDDDDDDDDGYDADDDDDDDDDDSHSPRTCPARPAWQGAVGAPSAAAVPAVCPTSRAANAGPCVMPSRCLRRHTRACECDRERVGVCVCRE
jgi:hypothetical protein